jgi:hypothetical protein
MVRRLNAIGVKNLDTEVISAAHHLRINALAKLPLD